MQPQKFPPQNISQGQQNLQPLPGYPMQQMYPGQVPVMMPPHMMGMYPPMMPMMAGPPPGFPRPPVGVIIGQPVMRAPALLPPPPIFGGGLQPPPGWTPQLAVSAPSRNPVIATPISIFIGKIPSTLTDEDMAKILEVCYESP
jgi:hypothetical protein